MTKDNLTTVQRTISSAAEVCRRFRHQEVNLLVLDKSPHSRLANWLSANWPNRCIYQGRREVLERDMRYGTWYAEVGHDMVRDSVQRARIQLMLATKELGAMLDGILWQIDDDMCFQEAVWDGSRITVRQERDYFSEVRAYAATHPHVDAAIGGCTNAPPLPALLYMRHQLMDMASGSDVRPVLSTDNQAYHDLYVMESKGALAAILTERGCAIPFKELMSGAALTRPIVNGHEDPLALAPSGSILRGGNFMVFNSSVAVACIHPGFQFAGRIARRSDMAHLWQLQRMGYDIRPIQLSLFHDRRYEAATPDRLLADYLDDALGATAIRTLESIASAQLRLNAHEAHMHDLVVLLEHLAAFSLAEVITKGLDELRSWRARGLEDALTRYRERMLERTAHAAYQGASGLDRPE